MYRLAFKYHYASSEIAKDPRNKIALRSVDPVGSPRRIVAGVIVNVGNDDFVPCRYSWKIGVVINQPILKRLGVKPWRDQRPAVGLSAISVQNVFATPFRSESPVPSQTSLFTALERAPKKVYVLE